MIILKRFLLYFLSFGSFCSCYSVYEIISNSLLPHGVQHIRLPCLSPSLGICSNSCPLSQWCHPTISSSVAPFSCLQSFPGSGSFPVSQLFTSGGQSIGASASATILPMNLGLISFRMDWFDLLAVQGILKSLLQHHSSKASIPGTQLSSWSNSHPFMTSGKTTALTRWTFID